MQKQLNDKFFVGIQGMQIFLTHKFLFCLNLHVQIFFKTN